MASIFQKQRQTGAQCERIDAIIIEEEVAGEPLVSRFLEKFPAARVIGCRAGDRETLVKTLGIPPKRALYLARHKGSFIKPFRRSSWQDARCEYSLVFGFNCFSSCHYCFIQSYFEDPIPTLFVNTGDMVEELRRFLAKNPEARISTGEFTDSFQMDDITRTTEKLLDVIRDYPRCILEMRTKSENASHLPEDPPPGALVAWSINPREVILKVEPGSAGFEPRLQTARELSRKGYRIALRIDPIIPSRVFKSSYENLARDVESILPWSEVEEVFLGVLRFDHGLLKIFTSSRPLLGLLDAEYIRCPDGRYRPHKFARIELYSSIVSSTRAYSPGVPVTLSMEPAYIRDSVFARP